MQKNKTYVNEDTYQTLKDIQVKPLKPRPKTQEYSKAITPLWKKKDEFKLQLEESPYRLLVCTPVHSDVSLHYTQALLLLQQACHQKRIPVQFQLMKSSLVTQGRNLCVAAFLESNSTHMLFIDSDIAFNPDSIFKMLGLNKDIISIPYPLKTFSWEKGFEKFKKGEIKTPDDLRKSMNQYPMRVENNNDIRMDNGVIEVTHAPTGCMLIKREVIDKMIKAYPELEIVQNTIINGKPEIKPHMWNFFDTMHDPETKTYLGEDFSFCKLWKDIGGKCHSYILDNITHVGEHQYDGRFVDELIKDK